MRIWDLPPHELCRQHLLGEHRELHALWSILRYDKQGYRRHPETIRWEGKLPALRVRHDKLVAEMTRRGYVHTSPLPDADGVVGSSVQAVFVDDVASQRALLQAKGCGCFGGGVDVAPTAAGSR